MSFNLAANTNVISIHFLIIALALDPSSLHLAVQHLITISSNSSLSSTFTVLFLRGNVELSGNIIPIPQICHKYTTYLSKNNFKILSHFFPGQLRMSVKLQNTVSFLEFYPLVQCAFSETLNFVPLMVLI